MAAPEGRAASRQDETPVPLTLQRKKVLIMDYDVIMNAITTVGFPIVVCAALFWYINKQNENHKSETEALRKTVEENTTIIHEVKELIKLLAGK